MFLKRLLERNRPLVEFAQKSHRDGRLLPDTYLLDLDAIEANARLLLKAGVDHGLRLYFMLKQIGRIPAVGQLLSEMGFAGAVCVDFREALAMLQNGIPIGNVGHLVQTPKAALERIIESRPDVMTVFSLEKAREISELCEKRGIRQNIMLRVVGDDDVLYPGQRGGFSLTRLSQDVERLEALPGVSIAGVTNFPCVLYSEKSGGFHPTPNAATVLAAAEFLRDRGHRNLQINLPSASCVASLPLIASLGGTHAEPGHSLIGTTPYHALEGSGPERPAVLYLSEISHSVGTRTYCYGGGCYSRGGLTWALVGRDDGTVTRAYAPSPENIDYHIELDGTFSVSDTVVMCFRTQIFVTRSEVAVVRGLSVDHPEIDGIYTAQGQYLRMR